MLSFILICLSFSTICADPQPDGGAPCTSYKDCGGIDGGYCEKEGNTSYCVCFKERGDPDCTYERIKRDLAGGLQFLCFVGVGGVGNFILGHNGIAAGQLILLLSGLIAICLVICIMCGCLFGGDDGLKIGGAISGCIICLAVCAILAGLGWNIADGARILQGKVDDHNGYHTY